MLHVAVCSGFFYIETHAFPLLLPHCPHAQEELSIMAKLEHANIVKCYGGNLEGSNPFIVTELCMCSLDKVRGGAMLAGYWPFQHLLCCLIA
jgi:hypothetical protein